MTLTPEEIIIVGDSIVQRGFLTRSELRVIAEGLPKITLDAVSRIQGVCESGTETKVRLWLESNRIRHRAQARIRRVGRVDFLIGQRLIIEVDSIKHHTGVENHQGDRSRDQVLIGRGYLVIRVTYADVMYRWGEVSRHILAVIRRGEHRHEPAAA